MQDKKFTEIHQPKFYAARTKICQQLAQKSKETLAKAFPNEKTAFTPIYKLNLFIQQFPQQAAQCGLAMAKPKDWSFEKLSQQSEEVIEAFFLQEPITQAFKFYCLECHQKDSSYGELPLEELTALKKYKKGTISSVFEQIKNHSMPPKDLATRFPGKNIKKKMLDALK